MAAPATAPETAVKGEALSKAAEFIFAALQGSGSAAAAAKYGALLKKWAKEGRPYKGQVFGINDVEAAIRAFGALQKAAGVGQAAGSAPGGARQAAEAAAARSATEAPPAGSSPSAEDVPQGRTAPALRHRVVLKAPPPWPPALVGAAAGEVAKSMGSLPPGSSSSSSSSSSSGHSALLKSLYELINTGSAAGGGDVTIATSDEVAVKAHKAVLCALSPVISCKFDGRFAGTADAEVNAREFPSTVVLHLLRFAYTGELTITESEVVWLFTLADFWQFSELKELLLSPVQGLRPIPALISLATLPTISAPELGPAMAAAAARGLSLAAQTLTPAPREPQPLQQGPKKVEEEWAQRAQAANKAWAAKNAPVWQFVRELREAFATLKKEDIERLRLAWIEDGGALAGPLEMFFVKTLGTGSRDEVRVIMSMRELIPDGLALRVARRLVSVPGLTDETGQPQVWIDWVCEGSLSFERLWSFYCTLRTQYAQTMASPESGAPTADGPPQLEDTSTGAPLPRLVESAFAMAFAGSLDNFDSAGRWAALLEHDTIGTWTALDESFQLVCRFVGRSRSALGNLSPACVLRVLRHATSNVTTSAVHIKGPPALNSISGIYHSAEKSNNARSFIRQGDADNSTGQQKLLLSQQARGARGSASMSALCMDWAGVPVDLLRAARFEWTIRRACDAEDDLPLALALDAAKDPTNITASWWIYSRKSRKFHRYEKLNIFKAAFVEAESAPFCAALVTWARKFSSTQGMPAAAPVRYLVQLVEEAGESAEALLQLSSKALKECPSDGDIADSLQAESATHSETKPECDSNAGKTQLPEVQAPTNAKPEVKTHAAAQVPQPVAKPLQREAAAEARAAAAEARQRQQQQEAAEAKAQLAEPVAQLKAQPTAPAEAKAACKSVVVPSPARAPSCGVQLSSGASAREPAEAPAKTEGAQASSCSSTLPRLEDDLRSFLDTFEDEDPILEPCSKVRRIGTSESSAEDNSSQLPLSDRRTEIQNYLRACPAHEVVSVFQDLLAARPDLTTLLGKELELVRK